MRVAINGFGRIGKQFFLAAMEKKVPWQFYINHTGDIDFVEYELKYDSVHPAPREKIWHKGNTLYFGNKKIKTFSQRDPEKLPWKKEKIDLVVECTGHFTEREEASKHLRAGAKKVLISAPSENPDSTIVFGVNNHALKKSHRIISAGSCTTNCIAPMVKILNDAYKIKSSYFVTVHAYTSTQRLIDGRGHKDLRRGRAAAVDIVPTTSGAATSVVKALPELKGRLNGYAYRVPVVDGSISSVFAEVEKVPTEKQINSLFRKKSFGEMKNILQYNEESIVSADIIHNPSSCIFDSNFTSVQCNLVSTAGWYDNEWGYSSRLVDVAKLILSK